MPVQIHIPAALRALADGEQGLGVEAGSVRDALAVLLKKHPALKGRLLDDAGAMRRFVNIYVNDEDMRHLMNLETPLKNGDVISIVPAIAGG